MKNLFTLLFFSLTLSVFAQDYPSCDGMRYRTPVFTEVTETLGQKFGEGTTISGVDQELFMDIYEPAGDVVEKRPVIILAFGGSFITGQRQDLATICQAYASMGYVAATIDYRLYDFPLIPFPTENAMKEVVVKSLSDMKAAIRFLREDAATDNEFRIDTDQVFVGGVSAGAICAAHTATIQETDEIDDFLLGLIEAEGGFEGNSSDNLEYSSEVQGFINMSGALNEADWIDANDPPFVSVHDDMDITVPYGEGFANVFGQNIVYLEGSSTMRARANEVGVTNDIMVIENSFGHVSYFDTPESSAATLSFTANFVADQICGIMVNTNEAVDETLVAIQAFPNPTADRLHLDNTEGLPLSYTLFNSFGQRVLVTVNTTVLDLSTLPVGMYLLQIENTETQTRTTKKVFVER